MFSAYSMTEPQGGSDPNQGGPLLHGHRVTVGHPHGQLRQGPVQALGQALVDQLQRCGGEVTRFDGYIAHFMGDGVLAYFGWPRAHEDDAERAVQAKRSDLLVPLEKPTQVNTQVSTPVSTPTPM